MESFATHSNDSADRHKQMRPGPIHLNVQGQGQKQFVSNTSKYFSESPDQNQPLQLTAKTHDAERNRLLQVKQQRSGSNERSELSMANIKGLFDKGGKTAPGVGEAPLKKGSGSKMEFKQGSYKCGTISPICLQNVDINNSQSSLDRSVAMPKLCTTVKEPPKLLSIPQINHNKHVQNLINNTQVVIHQQHSATSGSFEVDANQQKKFLQPLVGGDYHSSQGFKKGLFESKANATEAPRDKFNYEQMGLWALNTNQGDTSSITATNQGFIIDPSAGSFANDDMSNQQMLGVNGSLHHQQNPHTNTKTPFVLPIEVLGSGGMN